MSYCILAKQKSQFRRLSSSFMLAVDPYCRTSLRGGGNATKNVPRRRDSSLRLSANYESAFAFSSLLELKRICAFIKCRFTVSVLVINIVAL